MHINPDSILTSLRNFAERLTTPDVIADAPQLMNIPIKHDA